MSGFFILNIRIGKEFYPAEYMEGYICWDETRTPTIFDQSARAEVTDSLLLGGMDPQDFKWTEYTYKGSPSEQSHQLRLVREDKQND